MLKNDPYLIELDLSGMLLSDENVMYLCSILSVNKQVKIIDLSRNYYLSNKSVEYLLNLIEKNTKIEKIFLNFVYKISIDMKEKLNNKINKEISKSSTPNKSDIPTANTIFSNHIYNFNNSNLYDLSKQFKDNYDCILEQNIIISKRLENLIKIINDNSHKDLSDPEIFATYQKAVNEYGSIDSKYKLSIKSRENKSIIESNEKLLLYYNTFQKILNECINMSSLINLLLEKGYLPKNFFEYNYFITLSELGKNFPFGSFIFSLIEGGSDISMNGKRFVRYKNISRLNYNDNMIDVSLFVERLSRYFTIQYKSFIDPTISILSDDKKKSIVSNFKEKMKKCVLMVDTFCMDTNNLDSYEYLLSMEHAIEVIQIVMYQDEEIMSEYVRMLSVEKIKGDGKGDELIDLLFKNKEMKSLSSIYPIEKKLLRKKNKRRNLNF